MTKKFEVERTVVAVQFAIIEAETAEDAREEATHNPHLINWWTSSENGQDIQSVKEIT